MNKNCSVLPFLISYQTTRNEEGKRLKTLLGSKCCTVGTMLVRSHRDITQASTNVCLFAVRKLLCSSYLN